MRIRNTYLKKGPAIRNSYIIPAGGNSDSMTKTYFVEADDVRLKLQPNGEDVGSEGLLQVGTQQDDVILNLLHMSV